MLNHPKSLLMRLASLIARFRTWFARLPVGARRPRPHAEPDFVVVSGARVHVVEVKFAATSALIADAIVVHPPELGQPTLHVHPKAPKGFLLDAFLPSDLADYRLHALLGRYPHWVDKYGPRRARLIFMIRSIGCVVAFGVDWIVSRLEIFRGMRGS